MSKIIGLPSSIHDAAAALIIDGKVVFAMEEEKLTGIKSFHNQKIFPTKTLNLIKQKFDVDLHTCDHIAQSRFYIPDLIPKEYKFKDNDYFVDNQLRLLPSISNKIQSFSHHQCHAMGAYFTSGMEGKVISLSHDGAGTRSRGKIYLCEDGQTNLIHSQWLPVTSSLAGLWGVATERLGWAQLKDEGKVVGLAAHGKVNDLIYHYFSQCSYYENMDFKGTAWESMFRYICNKLENDQWFEKEEKRADFAATLQKFVEDLMLKLLFQLHQEYPDYRKLSLSGGLFANVKLNQVINDSNYFDEIYIHQAMNDAGLALGAAISKAVELEEIKKPLKIDHVYWGQNFTEEDWAQEIKKHQNLTSENFDIKRVASLIDSGHIVGLFIGQTEYGPRALGNRSILVRPTDTETHQKLNERLDRTETMPFAPSVLSEYADEIFKCQKSKYAAEFMTICYDTRDEWIDRIPAVVHRKDKSSRPHIVKKDTNPLYYHIIDEYRKISGFPIVLNTSLNAHGDPINNYPHQAIKLLLEGCLDYLITETNIYSLK
jgi:carbamoyltransferase